MEINRITYDIMLAPNEPNEIRFPLTDVLWVQIDINNGVTIDLYQNDVLLETQFSTRKELSGDWYFEVDDLEICLEFK